MNLVRLTALKPYLSFFHPITMWILLVVALTYLNNGKIVMGSHLSAGLGMVGLVSTSAVLVPFMQKSDWVRSIHVSLNLILLGLFG